jgi:hypothetical protein
MRTSFVRKRCYHELPLALRAIGVFLFEIELETLRLP